MLPKFPKFKPIEIADKEEVEKITNKYPPYSDFNFISMWSWDIKGEMRLSVLNDNLVVRFTDYISGQPFYSFLGHNKVNETAETLLNFSEKEGLKPILKLIPEFVANDTNSKKYHLEEDPDNFDYIYKNESLAKFSGKKFQNKRNLCNKFKILYPDAKVEITSIPNEKMKQDIIGLDKKWADNKLEKVIDFDIKNEVQAVERFFVSLPNLTRPNTEIVFCCLYVENSLVGFSISSIINQSYILCHFSKGNIEYSGVYEYMLRCCGEYFSKIGEFLNYEQDLGIPTLRFSKNSFRPASFLKKYVIVK